MSTKFERAQQAADELSEAYGLRIGALETYEGPYDRLSRRLTQARAMLAYIECGDGQSGFAQMAPAVQSSYIGAIGDLVSASHADARALLDELSTSEGDRA